MSGVTLVTFPTPTQVIGFGNDKHPSLVHIFVGYNSKRFWSTGPGERGRMSGAATLSITTFGITTLSIKCLCDDTSVTTLSIKFLYETLSITTLSIKFLYVTLRKNVTQYYNALPLCHYAEWHYAKWHTIFVVMLNVIILRKALLSRINQIYYWWLFWEKRKLQLFTIDTIWKLLQKIIKSSRLD